MRALQSLIAGFLLLVCLLAAYRQGFRSYHCNEERRFLEAAIVDVERMPDGPRRIALLEALSERAARCVEVAPEDYAMLVVRAQTEDLLSRRSAALASYRAALELNERPEIHANIALVELAEGNPDAAMRHLFRASIFNIRFALVVDAPMRDQVYAKITERIERLTKRASAQNH